MNTNPQLKIALVSDAVQPFSKGGKETRIDHLAKALASLGHDVHIYTMKWWPEDSPTYIHAGITYHAISKLYTLYVGKERRRSFKEGIMFGLACFRLLRYDYDLLEVDHMPYFPLFSMKLVSLIKRKPFFATWHEAVGLKAWRGYIGFVPGTIAFLMEYIGIRLPDHVIAVSERTYKQARDMLHYKGKMTLVSNGIDYPTILNAPRSSRESDIIFTGRLVKHKHADMLIRAVAELKKKRPTVKAILVGSGPEERHLRALVHELSLEKNVELTGRLEDSADVFSYMKASRVFVSPSTREGFGITILEAYACDLRVVTVNHPDNAAQYLVDGDLGIVCDVSVEAIARSIDTLLDIPKTRKLGVDASRFDWAYSVKVLEEAYGL